jgi:two-component system sensor histidine kinase KdpD
MPAPDLPNPLLVALGSDAQALRLIHATFWTSREQGRPWVAVHVEIPGEGGPEESDQASLWLEEATSLGGETLWIQSRTLVGGLLKALQQTGAGEILLGQGKDRWPWGRLGHSTAQELLRRQPGLRVVPLPLDAEVPALPAFPPAGQRLGAAFGGLGVLAACTGLGAILPREQPLPAVFLIFLLGTAFIADRWGLGVGALAVALAASLLDLALGGTPGHTVATGLPVLILLVTLLLGGQFAVALTQRLTQQTRASRRRAALLAALLLLGRNLAKATNPREVAAALAHLGERLLHRPIRLLIPQGDGSWQMLPEGGPAPASPSVETLARNSREGGLEPILDGTHAFLPLGHGEALEGALCLSLSRKQDLPEETWELLRAFALQVALALERARWLEAAQQTRLEAETERMRSALLGAISHDLRTPLAGIQGAASSLLLAPEALGEPARRDLLAMIHDESERLTQLLSNLLELTRLENGTIRVQKEWHPLDEVLGSALRRAETAHGPIAVEVDLPEDLPLIPLDGTLMEQLLINLLVNAHRYAPEGPVSLRAWIGDGTLELAVSDRGPGIPEDFRERIFEKFFRLPGHRKDGGVGLGLAICEAIARAHGGRIWAGGRSDGEGARFRVSLPMDGTPPPPPAAEEVAP